MEPYEYLLPVMSRLLYLGKSPAHEELEKLMPWHAAVMHREHIMKIERQDPKRDPAETYLRRVIIMRYVSSISPNRIRR